MIESYQRPLLLNADIDELIYQRAKCAVIRMISMKGTKSQKNAKTWRVTFT
jgi:hypothetical protein